MERLVKQAVIEEVVLELTRMPWDRSAETPAVTPRKLRRASQGPDAITLCYRRCIGQGRTHEALSSRCAANWLLALLEETRRGCPQQGPKGASLAHRPAVAKRLAQRPTAMLLRPPLSTLQHGAYSACDTSCYTRLQSTL